MTNEISHYDKVWEVLKRASTEMKDAGIPDHEMPPAVADFLIMAVLVMGRSNGLSIQAAEAIIKRMEQTVEDYKQGNPPFGKEAAQ